MKEHVGYGLQRISEIMEFIQDQNPYILMCLEWLEVKLNDEKMYCVLSLFVKWCPTDYIFANCLT